MIDQPLDETTLEALSFIVCGDEAGTKYRKGHEIAPFFGKCGLRSTEHDGSTRWRWTLDRLREFNRQPADIERILLRLAEPREYPGDPKTLNEVIRRLNLLLTVEGVRIVIDGTKPKLTKTSPTLAQEMVTVSAAVATPDFNKLCKDATLIPIMEARWKEIINCQEARAWLASIVMMGGLLESLLLGFLLTNPKAANTSPSTPKDPSGKPKQFPNWNLAEMITVAHEVDWIQKDAKDFSHTLRQYRNLIHPYEQRSTGMHPDEDTARICFAVVSATINDLMAVASP
jgi:hypothetical protein